MSCLLAGNTSPYAQLQNGSQPPAGQTGPNPPEWPLLPSKEHRQHTHLRPRGLRRSRLSGGTQNSVLKEREGTSAEGCLMGTGWNPPGKVVGRTTLGPELRARLVLSPLPRALVSMLVFLQPGSLGREARLLMSLYCPRWVQVAVWFISPGLTLAMCSEASSTQLESAGSWASCCCWV